MNSSLHPAIKHKNQANLERTNDASCASKASMCSRGYFNDKYIGELARAVRRTPLIHRGYFARVFAVDAIIRDYLNFMPSESRKQVRFCL